MIIKKDIPIIEEFLGTLDVRSMVTPFKTTRCYWVGETIENGIIIQTPMAHEEPNVVREVARSMGLIETEHKRGKNYVYTFKKA